MNVAYFRREHSIIKRNKNGGTYQQGRAHPLAKKQEVADTYFELIDEEGNAPSVRQLSQHANVSRDYAKRVVNEIQTLGEIVDPEVIRHDNYRNRVWPQKLTLDEQGLVLALRAEKPARTSLD